MRDLKKFPLRMGVLGCGGFLLRRVLPMVKLMEGIKIVCVQNRNVEKAKRIADEFGIPHGVGTREELLSCKEVEAVHVASPNFLHEEDAIACAKAGKPTLCEKPLSTSAESARRMIGEFEQRGVLLCVGHQMRFKEAVLRARELLKGGRLGRLIHLRAFYYSQTIPEGNWRLKEGMGGGALQEIGIHLIDLIHFVTGEEIVEARMIGGPGAERMASFQGRLSGGATVSFECGFERPYYNGFEVIGSEARVVSSDSLRQVDGPGETFSIIAKEQTDVRMEMRNVYVDEFVHFANVATNGGPTVIGAEIGLAAQKVVDMAYQFAGV